MYIESLKSLPEPFDLVFAAKIIFGNFFLKRCQSLLGVWPLGRRLSFGRSFQTALKGLVDDIDLITITRNNGATDSTPFNTNATIGLQIGHDRTKLASHPKELTQPRAVAYGRFCLTSQPPLQRVAVDGQ